MNQQTEIRCIAPEQTHHLRSVVLRPGMPLEECVFLNDDAPATIHVGAIENGRVVGIASFYHEAMPLEFEKTGFANARAWRLRGMAVEPMRQGQGIGLKVLQFGIAEIARRGGSLLWCNARTVAMGFYRIAGFEVRGEEFDIPGVGPHFVMVYRIQSTS